MAPSPEEMAYELGTKPTRKQRSPERLLEILDIILIEPNNLTAGQIIQMIGFLQNC